ncbi:hypothetical protein SAY87_001976 [Trapa incisa]|uniref:S1 motif domain-containing protein n=1 Tax=Trapa incisa TaxID=236973 RepID=A0AAN7PT99_9MYRT|nr:hypothetical protein SAY87_001976 [Trapa incisa]
MEASFYPCRSICLLNSTSPFLSYISTPCISVKHNKDHTSHRNLLFYLDCPLHRCKNSRFSSQTYAFHDFSGTQVHRARGNGEIGDIREFGLLYKPPLNSITSSSSASCFEEGSGDPTGDEALTPFFNFFKGKESAEEAQDELDADVKISKEERELKGDALEARKVGVEYYDPKPGDLVVGVVVSGNENKLDVNIGADLLGSMLTKELMPFYSRETDYLLCDLKNEARKFVVRGKMGLVKYDEMLSVDQVPGRPVVDTGTVLFAKVIGRTISGRPLLSARRLFRRIAWHRVRQIHHLNEPLEVKIIEWNTGGLLTRIEGLRAFLPKAELVNSVNSLTELKENVGRRIQVLIKQADEDRNDIILSEKEAWEMVNLQEGTLLNGTVSKIFPYGVQIRLGETNRSGLLHISNITRSRVNSVTDLFTIDEKVKVLVVKSAVPDKISLSIVDLESEPGLFLSDKEKVFAGAEEMAKKYRQRISSVIAAATEHKKPLISDLSFDEPKIYANWKWFKFEREPKSENSLW